MELTTKFERRLYFTLAGAFWLAETGLVLEKVLKDGVQSYTLLFSVPVITAAIGVLLHLTFTRWWGFLVALPLALTCFVVTLPASIGASGGARDAAVAQAEASNRVGDAITGDLKNVSKTLAWAQEDMISECASGEGAKCLGKKSTVKALQDRKDKLTGGLQEAPATATATSGETRIVRMLGWANVTATVDDVKDIWPILPPVAFSGLVAFFLTLGLSVKASDSTADTAQTSFPVPANPAELPSPEIFGSNAEPPKPRRVKPKTKEKTKNVNARNWVRDYTLKNGSPPKFTVVRNRHRLSNASASRVRSEGILAARFA